jgi:hypothetical protein
MNSLLKYAYILNHNRDSPRNNEEVKPQGAGSWVSNLNTITLVA